MSIKDWTKLVTVIAVIATVTYLGAVQVLNGEAVAGIISACLGYVFGNAHGVIETNQKLKEVSKDDL